MPPPCKTLLTTGACSDESCADRHDVRICNLCNIWCESETSYQQHLNGKVHRAAIQGTPLVPTHCPVCNITVPPGSFRYHERTMWHKLMQTQASEDGTPSSTVNCDLCRIDVPAGNWSAHLTSQYHKKKERFTSIKLAFVEAERDKNGVTVSHGGDNACLDFGVIDPNDLDSRYAYSASLTIKLNSTYGRVRLISVRMTSTLGRSTHTSFTCNAQPTQLVLNTNHYVAIIFNPEGNTGYYDDRAELVFEDTTLSQRFTITRSLRAVVGVQADLELLKPIAPYVRPEPKEWAPIEQVVEGVKPPTLAGIVWAVRLPLANIPGYVTSALANGSRVEKQNRVRNTLLPRDLTNSTYGRHWKTLLWVEEVQMKTDLQQYDMENVVLNPGPQHKYYFLNVPGLAEKRPSVIIGDTILVKNHGSDSGRWFRGYVHVVREKEVGLRFDPSFNSYRGNRYDVRFELNRLPLRRMHQALETAFHPDRVLFPMPVHTQNAKAPTDAHLRDINPFNRSIQSNLPQLEAVTAIRNLRPGSAPFIIFGPPGTGKTVTAIEAIRQILLDDSRAKILACAPSNSAADLLAIHLTDLGSQLFRLNAHSRNKESLPRTLHPFSQFNDEGTFSVPAPAKLSRYRVIVSTCFSASVPYGFGMQSGHFSHIFIDEAGQALEPEAMIPIKTMAGPDTNIVLSGDPKQLGPIVRSGIARGLGLEMSYLARLMKREVYNERKWHGITIVKLIKNWRSHPDILEFPNKRFYAGELVPRADELITHSLLRWNKLVLPDFPIIFHAITGKDQREASSPSFFNPLEVSEVKRYVEALFTDRRLRLTDNHIGIITPYNAQVSKIRTLLKGSHPGIKVGSVEEFQGQERRVIIISTVRSSIDFVDFDVKHTLGFVANDRRFNVAMTRAQALLIVIGDPAVLSLDPLWRSFLSHIHNSGGWTGKRIDWDPREDGVEGARSGHRDYARERRDRANTEIDELIERTKALILDPSRTRLDADEHGEHIEGNVDVPWPEEA